MPSYVQFKTEDGDAFLVEIIGYVPKSVNGIEESEPDGEVQASIAGKIAEKTEDLVAVSKDTFEDALNIVKSNATAFIRKVKELTDRPDEMQVSFGLSASGEFGNSFVVAKVGLEANYTVTLTWKNEQSKAG